MEKTLALVNDEKISVYYASKQTGVPYGTLRRRITNESNIVIGKASKKPVLSVEEEEQLITALKYSAECGYPQDRDDVAEMVKTFLDSLDRPNPFNNNYPGKDWMISFVRRHKETLRPCKLELLTKVRSEGLSENVVTMFYSLLEDEIQEKNILPKSIYNLDETEINTDSQAKKVFVPRTSQDAYLMSATCGKAMYSLMFCVFATGNYLPPFVVYKGRHLYNTWTSGGLPGCAYATTPSGWMQDDVFENWFKNFFIQSTQSNQKPVLLIYDGHGII